MRESGRVIRLLDTSTVEVEITQSPACVKCGICLFKPDGKTTIRASNGIGAAVGDDVEIEIPEKQVILSGFLIFIMPIIVFFSGYISFGPFTAAVLLFIYLIFLYKFDRKASNLPRIIFRQ